LIFAADKGKVEVVELLLNKGANIEATDKVLNKSEHSKYMHKNNIYQSIYDVNYHSIQTGVMFTLFPPSRLSSVDVLIFDCCFVFLKGW
jgi:hypothetical protein